MCRNCGSIVGGGEAQCAGCGASVSASAETTPPRSTTDRDTISFARAVLDRPYKFTIVLLFANIFIFILMWQTSGQSLSMSEPLPFAVLIAFGAKVNLLIQSGHQWWRFVTPMFLHVNLLHLIVNMYSLWMVGPYVEKLYGSAKFIVFWILTGICGVVASYFTVRPALAGGPLGAFIFKAADVPSAGASGARFGLVGVLFVFGIKFRHELPDGFKRAFGTGLLPMILLNLFIGYVLRGYIDNAAHLGGLVSGALLALLVDYRRPGERSGIAVNWRVLQWLAIVLVAVSFLKTVQHSRDYSPASIAAAEQQTAPENPAYLYYAKAINDAQEAFVVAVQDKNASNIETAVKNLDGAPQLDAKADELRQRLKALRRRAKEVSTAWPQADKNAMTTLTQDFVAWRNEYNQWLKTAARNYNGLDQIETK